MTMKAMRSICTVILALGFVLALGGDVLGQDANYQWQVRLRGLAVTPDESATITEIGGDVEIDEAYVPELDISYFFNPNWAAELVLATAPHDVMAINTSMGAVDVGSIWLLPPTLVLQYHPAPMARLQPYVGAGVNLTFFYNEDVPGDVVTEVDYDTAAGFALQGGIDIPMGHEGWLLNLDVKKVFLNTDVTLNNEAMVADVDIDPWLFGAGVGFRF